MDGYSRQHLMAASIGSILNTQIFMSIWELEIPSILVLVGEVTLNSSNFRLGGSFWSSITYGEEPIVGNLAANRELRDKVVPTIPAAVVIGPVVVA
jgi:hypothetical protein